MIPAPCNVGDWTNVQPCVVTCAAPRTPSALVSHCSRSQRPKVQLLKSTKPVPPRRENNSPL